MVKLSEAMGRLVLSGRELTRLAGFTTRVNDLVQVLNDLEKGNYTRTMLGSMEDNQDSEASSQVVSAESLGLFANNGSTVYQDNLIEFQVRLRVNMKNNILLKMV